MVFTFVVCFIVIVYHVVLLYKCHKAGAQPFMPVPAGFMVAWPEERQPAQAALISICVSRIIIIISSSSSSSSSSMATRAGVRGVRA